MEGNCLVVRRQEKELLSEEGGQLIVSKRAGKEAGRASRVLGCRGFNGPTVEATSIPQVRVDQTNINKVQEGMPTSKSSSGPDFRVYTFEDGQQHTLCEKTSIKSKRKEE